ncbi:hypothetical protein ACMHYB_55645 [Sorangium sp. So ce1128]
MPAAPPREPLPELWPPAPAGSLSELFDAVAPGRRQLPRGNTGAARGGDDPDDQGDLDRWAFDLGLLGALEAIPELLQATAKQMAKNALYLTPVGIPLAIDDINDLIDELGDAADRNGGGVPGLLDALNERFNPLAGLVRNTVEAVQAHEDKDARKLGNRMFKLGIEVLGMVGMLRGVGKRSGAPSRTKPANLPSLKRLTIDMDHIRSGHIRGGQRLRQGAKKDVFPETMSPRQIESSIREAYQNGQRIETQIDISSVRVLIEGSSGKLTIGMWVDITSLKIETAWPKYR